MHFMASNLRVLSEGIKLKASPIKALVLEKSNI